MKRNPILTVFALAGSLALFGCKDAHDHDHDHAHGDGHDHSEHAEPAGKAVTATTTSLEGATNVVAAAKAYTLDVCIVSDAKLGSMGEPYVLQHEGQEVKFCCESCLPKFEKDPAKYLTKLTAAKK
jgi:YHS domain-containing protein